MSEKKDSGEQMDVGQEEDEHGEVYIGEDSGKVIELDGNVPDEIKEEEEDQALAGNMGDLQVQDDSTARFMAHGDSVYCVDVNPADSTRAISGGGDDKAHVWNTKTGETVFSVEGHTDTVTNVGFSHDGQFAAVGSMDSTISVVKSADGELVSKLEGPASDIEFFAWHPRGPVIVAGSADTTMWMWNSNNGKCMQVFSAHMGPVLCGSFTHDGKVVVSGSEDGSAIVWNPKNAQPIFHFKGEKFHEGPINSLACHPDQRLLLTGSQDTTATFANIDNGKTLYKFTAHEDSVEDVGFCNKLKLGATASLDGKLKIWDLSTGQCRTTCDHNIGVVKLKWGNTEPLVHTASLDGVVHTWDGRTGKKVRELKGHKDAIMSVALSSDDSIVVTGSDDKSACVFNCK